MRGKAGNKAKAYVQGPGLGIGTASSGKVWVLRPALKWSSRNNGCMGGSPRQG